MTTELIYRDFSFYNFFFFEFPLWPTVVALLCLWLWPLTRARPFPSFSSSLFLLTLEIASVSPKRRRRRTTIRLITSRSVYDRVGRIDIEEAKKNPWGGGTTTSPNYGWHPPGYETCRKNKKKCLHTCVRKT